MRVFAKQWRLPPGICCPLRSDSAAPRLGRPQEPVAAAIAYGLHNTTEERTVVVYDMARPPAAPPPHRPTAPCCSTIASDGRRSALLMRTGGVAGAAPAPGPQGGGTLDVAVLRLQFSTRTFLARARPPSPFATLPPFPPP